MNCFGYCSLEPSGGKRNSFCLSSNDVSPNITVSLLIWASKRLRYGSSVNPGRFCRSCQLFWMALIFIYLRVVQAIEGSRFGVQQYSTNSFSTPFFAVQKQKSQQLHFCKSLAFWAETEIWTRDPFITSEVLYRWAICITCWKLEDSDETKGGFCIGVQHCVQQSLPAIACRLMIKWFINRELYGMRMKEDKHCNRGIFKPPLQSLSS